MVNKTIQFSDEQMARIRLAAIEVGMRADEWITRQILGALYTHRTVGANLPTDTNAAWRMEDRISGDRLGA